MGTYALLILTAFPIPALVEFVLLALLLQEATAMEQVAL